MAGVLHRRRGELKDVGDVVAVVAFDGDQFAIFDSNDGGGFYPGESLRGAGVVLNDGIATSGGIAIEVKVSLVVKRRGRLGRGKARKGEQTPGAESRQSPEQCAHADHPSIKQRNLILDYPKIGAGWQFL